MKKHITSIGLLGAFAMASLQANQTDAQIRNLENRVSALEQRKNANSMVNPSGRPQVRDGADLFINAEWLIWQAHENGLNYAVKTDSTLDDTALLYGSTIKDLHFDWDSGVRVGLGYNLPHDGWDVVATWTWFENKATGSASPSTPKELLGTQTFPLGTDGNNAFQSANSTLRLHLNFIDLELGREFFVSKWVTLRPFIGLRNAWVRQKQTTAYNTLVNPIFQTTQTGYLSKGSCNYWGLGPMTGLNTQWGLGCGLSLFGNGSVSLLNGFFDTTNYQTRQFPNNVHQDAVTNDHSNRIGR